ncbi:AcrZ family multidrug efflux pump-associated protein [Mixta intestinalis]|jgi:hypothetical protein|uniref:Multidrug efflux pump accessory protein AcrZ n=1 Tax=Mixta intestinalis TaxID=1615494 RepID=A0A6P1PV09_9GAMM|nr:AcrZ family multidrug efflux pump-associated protein [Mixta intestinalis]QHM70330.1 Multidrug efflux pump accessory protein AcrZ [Mixta intestinalis]
MLELLKSLAVAVIMVPVVMAIILGLIYGMGEVFNIISKFGHRNNDQAAKQRH